MLVQRLRMLRRLCVGQHIADVRFVDHLGAAAVLGLWQADVHVDAERVGDLGAQVLPDGAPGHPADQLAEDETEGHHVIALRGAGLPPRLGGRDVGAHRVPIGGVGPMQPSARSDDAGPMPQHHRDGDVLLARLAELRPVARHRGVQIDLPAVGQQMDTGAGQPLGTGVDAGQGVSSPWPQARGVGEATPQIDDEVAFHPDRNRSADVVAIGEVRGEGVAHPLEAGRARTVDGDPGRVEQGSSCRSCPRSERATESHPRGSLQLSTVAEQLPA